MGNSLAGLLALLILISPAIAGFTGSLRLAGQVPSIGATEIKQARVLPRLNPGHEVEVARITHRSNSEEGYRLFISALHGGLQGAGESPPIPYQISLNSRAIGVSNLPVLIHSACGSSTPKTETFILKMQLPEKGEDRLLASSRQSQPPSDTLTVTVIAN